jgi:NADP-dependent 3-hydroxy acid dehydrogenase YdfG
MPAERIAVVTGASSGIGAATARQLARAGFHVVAGARRSDRLEPLAEEVGATTLALDVTDPASVDAFTAAVADRHGHADLLVNNAGAALGLDPVADGHDQDWQTMLDTNVVGLLRVTRGFLPLLRAAPHAHIVNLGSIAGFEVYPGGAGYAASKHAVRAITQTLRLELNGEPIRITEIAPGMVETEFSSPAFTATSPAPTRSTPASSPSPPTTSPAALSGPSPAHPTSTSTSWSSVRSPRPPRISSHEGRLSRPTGSRDGWSGSTPWPGTIAR